MGIPVLGVLGEVSDVNLEPSHVGGLEHFTAMPHPALCSVLEFWLHLGFPGHLSFL